MWSFPLVSSPQFPNLTHSFFGLQFLSACSFGVPVSPPTPSSKPSRNSNTTLGRRGKSETFACERARSDSRH